MNSDDETCNIGSSKWCSSGEFQEKLLSSGGWTVYKCFDAPDSTITQGDSVQYKVAPNHSPHHLTETLELRYWAAGHAGYTSSTRCKKHDAGQDVKGALRKLAVLRLAKEYFAVYVTLDPPNLVKVDRVTTEDCAGQQVEAVEEKRLVISAQQCRPCRAHALTLPKKTATQEAREQQMTWRRAQETYLRTAPRQPSRYRPALTTRDVFSSRTTVTQQSACLQLHHGPPHRQA